jgi:hypothetical protein
MGGAKVNTRDRTSRDHQDLALVVLLALDKTGHELVGLASVEGLAAIAGSSVVQDIITLGLAAWSRQGTSLGLTDAGRDEARRVAAALADQGTS